MVEPPRPMVRVNKIPLSGFVLRARKKAIDCCGWASLRVHTCTYGNGLLRPVNLSFRRPRSQATGSKRLRRRTGSSPTRDSRLISLLQKAAPLLATRDPRYEEIEWYKRCTETQPAILLRAFYSVHVIGLVT